MMTSYFNLLKYAATGQASPDMTYYDRMRASTLMGGSTEQTLTGQPPLSFPSDGSPITIWSMIGNGQQTGTPSPQSIIMPTFCGVRTANLWDEQYPNISTAIRYVSIYVGDGEFTLSTTCPRGSDERYPCLFFLTGQATSGASSNTNGVELGVTRTVTATDGYVTIAYRGYSDVSPVDYETMLNTGSTALPYEPFGWAEKITCAGQTTPVYLGQVSTVRKIRKLVLTGNDLDYRKNTTQSDNFLYYIRISDDSVGARTCACSHLQLNSTGAPTDSVGCSANTPRVIYLNFGADIMNAQPSGNTVAGLKEYLAAQYAAGHPVTVWYVLATPETGIINEPLAKIGDYADELHSTDAAVTIPTAKGNNVLTIDTPIQPSEMTITYKG